MNDVKIANERKVAVVYVHGMGSQRRNEETSRLIDAIDYYLVSKSFQTQEFDQSKRGPREGLDYERIVAKRLRHKEGEDENYIRPMETIYVNPSDLDDKLKISFYEAYWAHETAGGVSSLSVIYWLLTQIFTPLKILWSSWSMLARIRKNVLISILHHRVHNFILSQNDSKEMDNFTEVEEFIDLNKKYLYYLRADLSKRRWFKIRFLKFLETVKDDKSFDPEDKLKKVFINTDKTSENITFVQSIKYRFRSIIEFVVNVFNGEAVRKGIKQSNHEKLFFQWQSIFVLHQIKSQIFIILLIFLLFELFFIIIFGYKISNYSFFSFIYTLFGIKSLPGLDVLNGFKDLENGFNSLSGAKEASSVNYLRSFVATVILLVESLFFYNISKFLSDYLGDVMQWTTYNESQIHSDKRKNILSTVKKVILTAMTSGCERVIIVGHSLGSTIALDALISLNYDLESGIIKEGSEEGEKIKESNLTSFISLGSPIDKIYYLYDAHPSKYPHHNFFLEQSRGNIEKWHNGEGICKNLAWINFYDYFDLISGPIYTYNNISPMNNNQELKNIILNVPFFYSYLGSPTASHSEYFENIQIIETIWQAIILKKGTISNETSKKYKDFAKNKPLFWYIEAFVFSTSTITFVFGAFYSEILLIISFCVQLVFFTYIHFFSKNYVDQKLKLYNSKKHINELPKGVFD